jgi:hypothetical protein
MPSHKYSSKGRRSYKYSGTLILAGAPRSRMSPELAVDPFNSVCRGRELEKRTGSNFQHYQIADSI